MISIFKKKKDRDEKEKGFFERLKTGLAKTRSGLAGRMDSIFLGRKEIDEELLEDLEEVLFTSDIGVSVTQELLDLVRGKVARKELNDPEKLKETLKDIIIGFFEETVAENPEPDSNKPLVIMVIGVNGVGKTTTIGKAAHMFREQDKKVMMVAADTFRAAAIEQLAIWGERVGADFMSQKQGSDPSAVVFDAIPSAISKKTDIVLIDTAGRLHTKTNLMDELQKIHRITGKKLPGAPHEVWLVLDATTGQNAVNQAKMFHETLGITGIVLTKLDGTAKGGIVISIARQLGIPIKFIGIGEKIDDLRPFDAMDFAEAIFS